MLQLLGLARFKYTDPRDMDARDLKTLKNRATRQQSTSTKGTQHRVVIITAIQKHENTSGTKCFLSLGLKR